MTYETEEKEAIKSILEKRKDLPPTSIVPDEPVEEEPKVKPKEKELPFDLMVKSKKKAMKEAITALKNYDRQLDELVQKKMTPFIISTASREALAEFATDSQSLLGEAKAIWTNTILPMIKGYEEALHIDTLEAESIIDDCQATFDKILEILVNREMEIVDEEIKREEIRQLAQKAVDDPEDTPSEAEDKEPEKDSEENSEV